MSEHASSDNIPDFTESDGVASFLVGGFRKFWTHGWSDDWWKQGGKVNNDRVNNDRVEEHEDRFDGDRDGEPTVPTYVSIERERRYGSKK